MKRVAISVGDLNGVGIELALRGHHKIISEVSPIYCIDRQMLEQASQLLGVSIPDDFQTTKMISKSFTIKPGVIDSASGRYSYDSFVEAVDMAKENVVDAILTLPINKKAWELAGIKYKGHTDALRDFFDADAIMMLGCEQMYVALYSEHIPLCEVAQSINESDLTCFFIDLYYSIRNQIQGSNKQVAVLGLNPHAGDGGVLGSEESIIKKAIKNANKTLKKDIFTDPLVPDVAFTPRAREQYTYYVAMYHDQGLAPLKALYFDESINVSLNLPILRTSVDHGTAFDIAYSNNMPSNTSYLSAVDYIAKS